MGRPKTININRADVLRGIADAYRMDASELTARETALAASWQQQRDYSTWQSLCDVRRELGDLEASGVPYELTRFSGRELTPSERIRWQQELRKLHADGLVELDGLRATHCKLTPCGWEAVKRV